MPLTQRPLRKDAERNRQLILEAARELFAERGLGVTLNDVAHHAGVGVGTVYRRFPDKAQLVDELFEQRVGDIEALARAALDDPDPWSGLSGFLQRSLEMQAADRGLKELILGAPDTGKRAERIRNRMLPVAGALLSRAREAGQLRPDFRPEDMPVLQMMIGTVIDVCRDVEPDLWRRYLELVLQGMRAAPEPPPPFAVPAIESLRVRYLIEAWQPPRR